MGQSGGCTAPRSKNAVFSGSLVGVGVFPSPPSCEGEAPIDIMMDAPRCFRGNILISIWMKPGGRMGSIRWCTCQKSRFRVTASTESATFLLRQYTCELLDVGPPVIHHFGYFDSQSQKEKTFEAVQEPFPALTRLTLHSHVEMPPVIPDSFLGGSAHPRPCVHIIP